MELDKTKRFYYVSIGGIVLFLISLGVWWSILVLRLAGELQRLVPDNSLHINLVNMIKWEGMTFVFLMIILAILMLIIFIRDQKKTNLLHAFFGSLTHELKTPLASIRLQSEVLRDLIEEGDIDKDLKEKAIIYGDRLSNDCIKLEYSLDKHLQLSRIEKNAPLSLVALDLQKEIGNFRHLCPAVRINEDSLQQSSHFVLVDAFALKMILRNLFENTMRHCQAEKKEAVITLKESEDFIIMTYNDGAPPFKEDLSQLGSLFFKNNSPNGSGIGLYLIKNLMSLMKGKLEILNDPGLHFKLTFRKANNDNA